MKKWILKLFLIMFWKLSLASQGGCLHASEIPQKKMMLSPSLRLDSATEATRYHLIQLLHEPDHDLFQKKVLSSFYLFKDRYQEIAKEWPNDPANPLRSLEFYWHQILLQDTEYEENPSYNTSILMEALNSSSKVVRKNLKNLVRWGILGPIEDPQEITQALFSHHQPHIQEQCKINEKNCYLLMDTFFNLDPSDFDNVVYPQNWNATHQALKLEFSKTFKIRFKEALERGHYHVTQLLLTLRSKYQIPIFEPTEFIYTFCPYLEMTLAKMQKLKTTEDLDAWLSEAFPEEQYFGSRLLKQSRKREQTPGYLKNIDKYITTGMIRDQLLREISLEFSKLLSQDPNAHLKLREFLSYANSGVDIYKEAGVRSGMKVFVLANSPHHLLYQSAITQNKEALQIIFFILKYTPPKGENPLLQILAPFLDPKAWLASSQATHLRRLFQFYFFSNNFPKELVLKWLEDSHEGSRSALAIIFDLNFFELLQDIGDFYDLCGKFKPSFHHETALNLARLDMMQRRLAKEDSPALKLKIQNIQKTIKR